MKYGKYFLLSLGIIALDQIVKMLVHFNMDMGSSGQIQLIGELFKLHYTLNPGMAFGLELGSNYGKLVLTIFRLLASAGIAFYMIMLAKKIKRNMVATQGKILFAHFFSVAPEVVFHKNSTRASKTL